MKRAQQNQADVPTDTFALPLADHGADVSPQAIVRPQSQPRRKRRGLHERAATGWSKTIPPSRCGSHLFGTGGRSPAVPRPFLGRHADEVVDRVALDVDVGEEPRRKIAFAADGMITTMSLPWFSGRFASCKAAQTAAPEEMPIGMPSSWLTCFDTGPESVSFTRMTSS